MMFCSAHLPIRWKYVTKYTTQPTLYRVTDWLLTTTTTTTTTTTATSGHSNLTKGRIAPAQESFNRLQPKKTFRLNGLRLPSQQQRITAPWPVPSYTAWWQRHMGVNNLPKVVTQLLPRVGFEPTTCWSQVQRSTLYTRCATAPPCGVPKINYWRYP